MPLMLDRVPMAAKRVGGMFQRFDVGLNGVETSNPVLADYLWVNCVARLDPSADAVAATGLVQVVDVREDERVLSAEVERVLSGGPAAEP